jgi:hypothetical protein
MKRIGKSEENEGTYRKRDGKGVKRRVGWKRK